MGEQKIRADGFELVTEFFGDPSHPPILLIMGGMASMLWWPEAFCELLAGRGRFVIRYDQRDTGRSTKYPPGEPGYSFEDFVDDAYRVLDGYRIPAAHFVGMSLGGMVSQVAAIKHPSRVRSLTAISSSPIGRTGLSLPGSRKAWSDHSAKSENLAWTDRAAVVQYMLDDARLLASTRHPFDEVETRAFIERDFDRSGGYLSATNHGVLGISDKWRGRLHEMRAPLLVIHGTSDPVYPFEHGIALSRAVKGAKLVRIEGGGHELHRRDWDQMTVAIAEHTKPTERLPPR